MNTQSAWRLTRRLAPKMFRDSQREAGEGARRYAQSPYQYYSY